MNGRAQKCVLLYENTFGSKKIIDSKWILTLCIKINYFRNGGVGVICAINWLRYEIRASEDLRVVSVYLVFIE